MTFPHLQRHTLALAAVLTPILLLFAWVFVRSGPLAPTPMTTTTVESRPLLPAIYGIGTVQARYTWEIGPVQAGRLTSLNVDVGDMVEAGQLLGEMDPIDLDDRIAAQEAAIRIAKAALDETEARARHARTEATRYRRLLAAHGTSEELTAAKDEELARANAAQSGARDNLERARNERDALRAQRENLSLRAPATGLVTLRHVDPGTVLMPGQSVLQLIDPETLWIDTRFDQRAAEGLAIGLPARITLRSRQGQTFAGHVFRLEPRADAVTEETLAKIRFDTTPMQLPPLGELAEVTVELPRTAAAPTIPNAALHAHAGKVGVWKLDAGKPHFQAVSPGAGDLEGNLQIQQGLGAGDEVVVYSPHALDGKGLIHITRALPEMGR